MARDRQHAHALERELLRARRVRAVEAEPLARYGVAIFEAGPARLGEGRLEPLCQGARGVDGVEAPLLDPEIEVLAAAARDIGRDLVDLEVLGRIFDAAHH